MNLAFDKTNANLKIDLSRPRSSFRHFGYIRERTRRKTLHLSNSFSQSWGYLLSDPVYGWSFEAFWERWGLIWRHIRSTLGGNVKKVDWTTKGPGFPRRFHPEERNEIDLAVILDFLKMFEGVFTNICLAVVGTPGCCDFYFNFGTHYLFRISFSKTCPQYQIMTFDSLGSMIKQTHVELIELAPICHCLAWWVSRLSMFH